MIHNLSNKNEISFTVDTDSNEILLVMNETFIHCDDEYQFDGDKKPLPVVLFLQGMLRHGPKMDDGFQKMVQRFCLQTEKGRKWVMLCECTDMKN
jgi:hypothetical protein